ncbi:hypothetical protein [Paracoccus siganidrum]|uniref:hypothetical protein n=1 Tax=Paracoccus siganidrum TaxID=1276757 RepID=UPI0016055DEE|nr:hypothetical protein [Paracoccus siganidrum]
MARSADCETPPINGPRRSVHHHRHHKDKASVSSRTCPLLTPVANRSASAVHRRGRAADAGNHADGGGKRPATVEPIIGFDAVMKTQACLATWFEVNGATLVRTAFVSGLSGVVTLEADGELQATALEIEDGKLAAIHVVRNPDKSRLPRQARH